MVAIAVVIVGIAAATQIDPSYSPGAADVRPQSTTCFSTTHASLLLGTASQSFQLFCTAARSWNAVQTQTAPLYRPTSTVVTGHIYAMHAMRPNNSYKRVDRKLPAASAVATLHVIQLAYTVEQKVVKCHKSGASILCSSMQLS